MDYLLDKKLILSTLQDICHEILLLLHLLQLKDVPPKNTNMVIFD